MRDQLQQLRVSHIRYLLIFSLAPIFPHMKNSLVADKVLGLDGVFMMGIAYSLGLGLLFLLKELRGVARFARGLGALTGLFFLAWLTLPQGLVSQVSSMLFSLCFGGCAGVALFAYSNALNDGERLLGAALASLFCLLSQVFYSVFSLWEISGTLYLISQVAVTVGCLCFYRQEDFHERASEAKPSLVTLATMLFVFLAHRAVMFFYSYLPASLPSLLSELVGIGIFLLSLFIFFVLRFKIWHLCNIFFSGLLISYALRVFMPGSGGQRLSEVFSAFSHTGFLASYYLLGYTLHRHVDFKRFKSVLFLLFNGSLLLHVVPGRVYAANPEAVPVAGGLLTMVLFLVFVIGSPAMFQRLYHAEEPAQPPPEVDQAQRWEELMMRYGLNPREREVAVLLLQGHLIKQCADIMGVSPDTVKYHARNVYQKTGIGGRTELHSFFYGNHTDATS